MLYSLAVAHFGGLRIVCFQGDDKIEEKFLKGKKTLDDIDLLPHSLKEQSLSDQEIVLTPENVSRAVDVLVEAQWAVVGWEPWLKLADGSHFHPIGGGDFVREEHEDWIAYVHRAAHLCRQAMKEEQERRGSENSPLKGDPDRQKGTLYFCLTAVAES